MEQDAAGTAIGDGEVSLLLVGGQVIDGTGSPAFRADVAVAGDRVVAVGALDADVPSAVRRVDVAGRTIVPGFIDAHGHSDLAVLSAPDVPSKIRQGVTTEIMGNCGVAVAPVGPEADLGKLRATLALIDYDTSVPWDWRSVDEYLSGVERSGTAMNVALLAGHLAMRVSCVGYEDRPATDAELREMQRMLDKALREGAVGLATGLMYPPASFADLHELCALAEVVAAHGAIFSFHMRDYSTRAVEAVEEAIEVARRTGVRVQLSHLAVAGRPNWGKVAREVALIDAACDEGLDVAFDIYPYLAGSTGLTQWMPDWALEGGMDRLLVRLADPSTRDRIRSEVESTLLQEPQDILIAAGTFTGGADDLLGATVLDLSQRWGLGTVDTMLRLLDVSDATVSVVAFGRSEEDLRAALRSPRCLIGSDGFGLDPDGPSGQGMPHPRSYGCYPRLLGQYVREEGLLRLEEAIHRSTGLVAERFGIRDRGLVRPGAYADLLIIDPATIADLATYTDPHRYPAGINTVIVRGRVVLDDGATTGERPGEALRDFTGRASPAPIG